ncbi:MAG: nitrate reductase NapD [Motiliproteus sp.]|jgi:nitrate reductase NapD
MPLSEQLHPQHSQRQPLKKSAPASNPELFDITGMVVRTLPASTAALVVSLKQLKGVEVHAIGDEGNLVVTVEELNGEKFAIKTIETINNMPGVLSTSLVYHHDETDSALAGETP